VRVEVYQIERDQVMDYWPKVATWLDTAYGKNDIPMPETMRDDLLQGFKQLWVAWEPPPANQIIGAALTRLARMRSGLHCEIVACAGHEVERWVDGIALIEAWAKIEGCKKVTIVGRPGWMKLLRNYRQREVMLELEL
jgi:hypothetical protein